MPDGRVAFLDFGMTKKIARTQIAAETALIKAALEGDAEEVHAGLAALGFFDRDDPEIEPDRVLAHVRALQGWYAEDRSFTITRDYIARVMVDAGDPRSEYWDLMKRQTMPPKRCSPAGWRDSRSACSASSRRRPTGTGS